MPKWNEVGGIGELGWAIARLKENGTQFLPFIENKRKEIEELAKNSTLNNKNSFDKCLESYDYVIDALKNKTGYSNKYTMSHGKGIEYYLSQNKS